MSYSTPPHPSFPSSTYNPSTPPPPPPKPSGQTGDPLAFPSYPSRQEHQVAWQDQTYTPNARTQAEWQGAGDQHMHQAATRPGLQQGHTASHRPQLPDPGWVPQILLDKSKPDLEAALRDPALITALLHSPRTAHPALTASQAALPPLLAANTALAQHLLHLSSTVEVQRAHTSARLLSVRALEQQWRKKQAELEQRLEPWGPRELHQRLGAAIVEGEALCKGVEDSFLESGEGGVSGEREVAEWIRRVREGRRVVALRRERKARWDEGRVGGWR